MDLTKTEVFTEEQNMLATMLKALEHPARIAILQLMNMRTCTPWILGCRDQYEKKMPGIIIPGISLGNQRLDQRCFL